MAKEIKLDGDELLLVLFECVKELKQRIEKLEQDRRDQLGLRD